MMKLVITEEIQSTEALGKCLGSAMDLSPFRRTVELGGFITTAVKIITHLVEL
jgi:hypothetical protein